jgi:hypothetical protein
MFRKKLSPPSSGSKSKLSKKPAEVGGKLGWAYRLLPLPFCLSYSSPLKTEATCFVRNIGALSEVCNYTTHKTALFRNLVFQFTLTGRPANGIVSRMKTRPVNGRTWNEYLMSGINHLQIMLLCALIMYLPSLKVFTISQMKCSYPQNSSTFTNILSHITANILADL